ncbi:MAG: DUF1657 domain-containing protein, partial [Desulfofundulus sp.]
KNASNPGLFRNCGCQFKNLSLDTQDQTAKQMFASYSQQLENICNGLRGRVNYLEQQEPQYRVMQPKQQQQKQ